VNEAAPSTVEQEVIDVPVEEEIVEATAPAVEPTDTEILTMTIPEGQEEQKGESGEATHVKLSACEVSSHNQTSQTFQASDHTNSPEAAITLTTISEEQADDGSGSDVQVWIVVTELSSHGNGFAYSAGP
jgi:hypothetical protein